MLQTIPRWVDENVLVGFDTADDAGVYKLSPECALVQTVDFFTPIVDDPFTFGAIAAANSLSDVYAMGGRPVSALSILAWPAREEPEDLEAILRGGAGKMHEAGCSILGGHSVADEEIKFGYSVAGLVHPDRILRNGGAHAGDLLVLTKPIGTGVIATAGKRDFADPGDVEAAIRSMLALNRDACDGMLASGAHGCTDITGFGLIGHAREMALASGVTLEIDAHSVPLLPGALVYSRQGALAAGLKNNREFAASCVEHAGDPDPDLENLLYDPQTSGGLLASAPRAWSDGAVIGRVVERREKPLRVVW